MRVSWIKYEKDERSFKIPENLGFAVFRLEDLEQTDQKIKELINQEYHTIVLSREVAGFSEDIIKKYAYDDNVQIIIK